jgi:hypothetical protein
MRPEHPIIRFRKYCRAVQGCWLWTGYLDRNGYGKLHINAKFTNTKKNRVVYAHRWGYEYFKGPVPKGLVLDHLCRNPRCVNPEHLEPVPQGINSLRGVGLVAINAAKTHCPLGHAYDDQNTILAKNANHRQCRTCRNRQSRKRWKSATYRAYMKKYKQKWIKRNPTYWSDYYWRKKRKHEKAAKS